MMSTILLGWAVLLCYQTLRLGAVLQEMALQPASWDWKAAFRMLPPLAPAWSPGTSTAITAT